MVRQLCNETLYNEYLPGPRGRLPGNKDLSSLLAVYNLSQIMIYQMIEIYFYAVVATKAKPVVSENQDNYRKAKK